MYKILQLKDCKFNIAYFNLIFYSGYMMHALLSWLAFPFVAYNIYSKIRDDTHEINKRIARIANVPVYSFDPSKHTAQKCCSICIADFTPQTEKKPASQITNLSCDYRHYFHSDCIKFWLHRQSVCPLCKTEVNYEKLKR